MASKPKKKYDNGEKTPPKKFLGYDTKANPINITPPVDRWAEYRHPERLPEGVVLPNFGDPRNATPISNPVTNKSEMETGVKLTQPESYTAPHWRNPFENVKGHDTLQGFLYATDAFVNWQDNQRNAQNYYRTLRNTFTQKPIWDYNNLWGPDSNGGAEYQPLIMAKNGAEIRKSSSPIHGNVEIEGGEFLQLPDLQTEHIQGNSHETGGVHTNLPSGAKVFSDHLKPKGSKRTYAQLAKKYDTLKYKEVLDNPFAKDPDRRTAEIMFGRNQNILNNLFQDQQLQNGNSDGTEFKKGGLYGDDGFLLGNSGKLKKSKTEIGYDPYKSKGSPLDRTRIGKADNSSKLTAEQIDELASLIGYTGPANNLALQQYLLKNNPDIVNQLHTTYGQPNAGKPDDGLWGIRWDAVLQAVADKVKSSQPPVTNVPAPSLGNIVKNEPTVDTSGRTFGAIAGVTKPYSRIGKFPLYQAAPETLGFLSAISPYSYYTPDFTHNELVPATLNIQPQLNSINSSLQSGIRQNTGNASLMNARNTAMFNQALEAKQQAFANKQNYDAQNRFNADQFNAQARTKENYDDLSAAATVYNEYRASALDNASTERLNAIASLTNKTAQFYQDEFRKKLFFDTQTPNYYYDGLNIDNPIVYTGEKPTFEAAPKTKASLSRPKKK